MVTPLLFLTVSAFSTPLLENSSYHQQGNTCFLTVNEERNQQDIVLLLSLSANEEASVTVFHRHAFAEETQGFLRQSATKLNNWYANQDYPVSHRLYKDLGNAPIYATTLAAPSSNAVTFIDVFKTRGNKTRLSMDGMDSHLSFVADKVQADAFYQCGLSVRHLAAIR
ncbi:hypothetical protein [Photobacterium kagoshimensis]|uniref:hypothetical protein n=1 Tax=Photobacterium kagoshimensis TaxID=2910242 RepID=UPI003D148898